jgi:hypothetical protein
MHYRYRPYPYYRRYYNLDPYYYRRYYNPYYNIIDSQIADVDQSIVNYGDMADTSQDSVIYQSRTAAPKTPKKKHVVEVEVDEQPEPMDIEEIPIEDSSEESDEEPTPVVF